MGGPLLKTAMQLVFATGFIFSWASLCPAGQIKYSKDVGDLERKLLNDCLARHPQLMDRCGNLTMSIETHGYLGPQSNPRERFTHTQDIYTNGNRFFRIDEVGRRRSKTAHGKEMNRTSIWILRPEGFIQIGNTPQNPRFVVENIQGTQEEHIFRIMSAGTAWCILTVNGAPLKAFLSDPPPTFGDYVIERVDSAPQEGRSCLLISAMSDRTKDDRVSYRLLVDKESSVLREYRITDSRSNQANCGRMEYDFSGTQDRDIPPLTRYTAWAEVGAAKYNEMVHEVKQTTFGPAPLEVFDPASLGLNVAFPKKQAQLLWLYLAAAGLACVAVYIFGFRSRKNGAR
jgi:hypothetical protein